MMQKVSAIAVLAFSATAAMADSAATCDRLEAEAAAEAVVLYAPRVVVEAARAPSVIDSSDPVAFGGLQARASLAFSATDALRGRAIERIAAAECVRTRAADHAGRVLGAGTRLGELAATRAEIAYREARLPEVDALITEAAARFGAQRTTAYEVDELRERRAAMRVRLAELRHGAGVLEQLDRDVPTAVSLDELARAARTTELAVDRRRAELRALSAWRFDVRGGVAAGDDSADWFAVVELGYSFGQPWQRGANRRALAAREREQATDHHAVAMQLDQLRRAMRASVDALAVELRMIDEEIATVRGERDRVAPLQTDPARQLFARFSLALIELEARRTNIETLATTRRPLAGDP